MAQRCLNGKAASSGKVPRPRVDAVHPASAACTFCQERPAAAFCGHYASRTTRLIILRCLRRRRSEGFS